MKVRICPYGKKCIFKECNLYPDCVGILVNDEDDWDYKMDEFKKKIVKEYVEGKNSMEIADDYNIALCIVREWIRKEGHKAKTHHMTDREIINILYDYFERGLAPHQLSEKYERKIKFIREKIRKFGIGELNTILTKKEMNKMSVTTEAEKKMDSVKEKVSEALKEFQDVYTDSCWGADKYKDEYVEDVFEALMKLKRTL